MSINNLTLLTVVKFAKIDAEVSPGLVDEDSAGYAGPAGVACGGFVLEYGQRLPETDECGGNTRESLRHDIADYHCVNHIRQHKQGVDFYQSSDDMPEAM